MTATIFGRRLVRRFSTGHHRSPMDGSAPSLIFIVGPPAVGKMTVGTELATRTGYRLLHNHQTIDLVTRFFPFGSPQGQHLVKEFRRRILEEVAVSDLPGLIFTYVWAFDDPGDAAEVMAWSAIFQARGGRVLYVELEAPLEARLQRNETEFRLSQKARKRNVEESRRNLLSWESKYQMNSGGKFDDRADYFRLNNGDVSAVDAAERIIQRFGLTRAVA